MATFLDALGVLAGGPRRGMLSCDVAAALWPTGSITKGSGKAWNRPHHGGPTGGQRAAAGLLGRLAKLGQVGHSMREGDPRTYWVLTDAGRARLASVPESSGPGGGASPDA